MKKATKRRLRVILRWYQGLHPELSLRQLWVEFYRYCRTHKLGDIHAHHWPLMLLCELFDYRWVQLIREDFGSDPLGQPIEKRAEIYRCIVKMHGREKLPKFVRRYIHGES